MRSLTSRALAVLAGLGGLQSAHCSGQADFAPPTSPASQPPPPLPLPRASPPRQQPSSPLTLPLALQLLRPALEALRGKHKVSKEQLRVDVRQGGRGVECSLRVEVGEEAAQGLLAKVYGGSEWVALEDRPGLSSLPLPNGGTLLLDASQPPLRCFTWLPGPAGLAREDLLALLAIAGVAAQGGQQQQLTPETCKLALAEAQRLLARGAALEVLSSMGCKVYDASSPEQQGMCWECLAGSEGLRKEVEEGILWPMQWPQDYAALRALTREGASTAASASAFLLAGPPGTGKTTTARIIAASANRPLVVLSWEAIGSPYHAQSEKNLAAILQAVSSLQGAVLLVDEAEAVFPSRYAGGGGVVGAVGNKLLAILLQWLEGVGGAANAVLVMASNRAEGLDPALLSRCSRVVSVGLPGEEQRAGVWRRYAKQLGGEEVRRLVRESEGMSGRDVLKVCEGVEREWVGRGRRGEGGGAGAPAGEDYCKALRERMGRRKQQATLV